VWEGVGFRASIRWPGIEPCSGRSPALGDGDDR
jgi:hypothetical protein